MIYLLLKGGIGNQLFQFGAALRATKRNIDEIIFVINKDDEGFKFKLDSFFHPDLLPKSILLNNLLELINSGTNFYKITDEHSPLLDSPTLDLLRTDQNYLLDGYFQSHQNANVLRAHFFNPTNINISAIYYSGCNISLHIRLGDYLRQNVQNELGLVDFSYFDRCVSMLPSNVTNIQLFSDDEKIFKIYGNQSSIFNYQVNNEEIETFHKLRSSNILIIPNSTFSLMAAYLSSNLTLLMRPVIWSKRWIHDQLTSDLNFQCDYVHNSFGSGFSS